MLFVFIWEQTAIYAKKENDWFLETRRKLFTAR
jgi:hypothetical protein